VDRQIARLVDGAKLLELGEARADVLRAGIDELAAAVFPAGEGIVRLQLSRDSSGLRAVGTTRGLGPERPHWTALLASIPHDGVSLAGGLKTTNRLTLTAAAQQAAAAGVDEALLADVDGNLVEGSRSNLFVVLADGTLATPPLESGLVAGIARAVCLERVPEIVEQTVCVAQMGGARELVAVNAVRGALAIVQLDGAPFAGGQPGDWSRRLGEVLAHD
jgi:branched-subunit amino acid aminotransferase/4-amino-4-deoxychorismate lyase